MCKLGLLDFIRQTGSVNLHGKGTMSDATYEKLVGAKGVIKSYIKNTNFKVDLYDANSLPSDEFVYKDARDNIRVKVADLLNDKVHVKDFVNKHDPDEPLLRQIYEFVQNSCYCLSERPIERMKRATNARLKRYHKE